METATEMPESLKDGCSDSDTQPFVPSAGQMTSCTSNESLNDPSVESTDEKSENTVHNFHDAISTEVNIGNQKAENQAESTNENAETDAATSEDSTMSNTENIDKLESDTQESIVDNSSNENAENKARVEAMETDNTAGTDEKLENQGADAGEPMDQE